MANWAQKIKERQDPSFVESLSIASSQPGEPTFDPPEEFFEYETELNNINYEMCGGCHWMVIRLSDQKFSCPKCKYDIEQMKKKVAKQ